MEKDARDVAIVHAATIQAKADKAKAASNDQAKAASNDKAKAASNDQAKAESNEKDQDGKVALVTRDQKKEGLKMWKELLIQNDQGLSALPTTYEGGEFKGG